MSMTSIGGSAGVKGEDEGCIGKSHDADHTRIMGLLICLEPPEITLNYPLTMIKPAGGVIEFVWEYMLI